MRAAAAGRPGRPCSLCSSARRGARSSCHRDTPNSRSAERRHLPRRRQVPVVAAAAAEQVAAVAAPLARRRTRAYAVSRPVLLCSPCSSAPRADRSSCHRGTLSSRTERSSSLPSQPARRRPARGSAARKPFRFCRPCSSAPLLVRCGCRRDTPASRNAQRHQR
jgi:hypothetical protein